MTTYVFPFFDSQNFNYSLHNDASNPHSQNLRDGWCVGDVAAGIEYISYQNLTNETKAGK